ncbi:MAG: hypothetical protein AB1649_27745, partial [Chloroflexota bacterium]
NRPRFVGKNHQRLRNDSRGIRGTPLNSSPAQFSSSSRTIHNSTGQQSLPQAGPLKRGVTASYMLMIEIEVGWPGRSVGQASSLSIGMTGNPAFCAGRPHPRIAKRQEVISGL